MLVVSLISRKVMARLALKLSGFYVDLDYLEFETLAHNFLVPGISTENVGTSEKGWE